MATITVQTKIKSDIKKVWEFWTNPKHIENWNFATNQWHCPSVKNILLPNGRFSWRMESKDGSMGFDFSGIYEKVEAHKLIKKRLDDERKIEITFIDNGNNVEIIETFEPDQNDEDLQKQGWQAILNNFKKYVESN